MQIMIGAPVLIPYPAFECLPGFQNEMLVELRSVSDHINAIDSDLGKLTVSIYDSPEEHPLIAKHWTQPQTPRNYRLLTVAAEVVAAQTSQLVERMLSI